MEHIERHQLHSGDEKDRIVNYWTKRSHDFSELRVREQKAEIGQDWLKEILPLLPADRKCTILDVGCGTGFFALMLSEFGHEVIGVDLTEHMILHAREIAAAQNNPAQFFIMDAEKLDLPDGVFDMVITRNLTWTLPHADEAYLEWMRVLKKGGILLNFDADYGHDQDTAAPDKLPENHAHKMISREMTQEHESIKSGLKISSEIRPAWDVQYLSQIGFSKVEVDEEVYKRIYKKIDEFYNPTPIFKLVAVK